jgi:signal transduction histidine kinase
MAKAAVSFPIRSEQQDAPRRPSAGRHLNISPTHVWPRSPARRFQLASFVVLLVGMLGTGWWLSSQIEQRVIEQTVDLNAAFIESFVAPLLQNSELLRNPDSTSVLTPLEVASLDSIFQSPLLDDRIVGVCLWTKGGRVLYNSSATPVGRMSAPNSELRAAFNGRASWEIESTQGNHDDDMKLLSLQGTPSSTELLGVYTPVRQSRTGPIITVAEFFLAGDPLRQSIAAAQQQTWIVVGGVALLTYLLLAGFIQRTSDTVVRQQATLSSQVERLQDLLRQNNELRARMRQASRRAVTLHEQTLRALSADLHDGPAQYLGLAFLHLDRIAPGNKERPEQPVDEHLAVVQSSLGQVMQEIRAIAAGLGVPQLETLSLQEVVAHVVRAHERRYHTHIWVATQTLPEYADVSIKTTLYRVIQEGLTNASRHGRGIDERVAVSAGADTLKIEISDGGPGFEVCSAIDTHEHMGLSGMRARVESLGGTFTVRSTVGMGTQIQIQLPLSDSADGQ